MSSVLTLLSGDAGLWIVCGLLVLLMAAYLIGYSRGHEDGGDEALGRHIMRPTDTLPTVRHDVPVVRSGEADPAADRFRDLCRRARLGDMSARKVLRDVVFSPPARAPRQRAGWNPYRDPPPRPPFELVLPDEDPAAYLEPEARPWSPAERKLQDVS